MSAIHDIRDPMTGPILPLDTQSKDGSAKAICLILILIFLIVTISTGSPWFLIPAGVFTGIALYSGREKKYDSNKDPICQNFLNYQASLDRQFETITESLRGHLPKDSQEAYSIERKVRQYENERVALRRILKDREKPFSLQETQNANRLLKSMRSILESISPDRDRLIQINQRIRDIETSLESMLQQPEKYRAAIATNQKLLERYQKEIADIWQPHS